MSTNLRPIKNYILNVDSKVKYLKRQVSENLSDMHEIKAYCASSKEISAISVVRKRCKFDEDETAHGALFILMKEAAIIESWTKSAIPNHVWQILNDKTKQKLSTDLKNLPESSLNAVGAGGGALSASVQSFVDATKAIIHTNIKQYQQFMHDAFEAINEANEKLTTLKFYPLTKDMKIDLTKIQIQAYERYRVILYKAISHKNSKWFIYDQQIDSDLTTALEKNETLKYLFSFCNQMLVRRHNRMKLKRLEALKDENNDETFFYDEKKKYKSVEFSMKHLEGSEKEYMMSLRRRYLHDHEMDDTKKKLNDIFRFMIDEHKKLNKKNWCVLFEKDSIDDQEQTLIELTTEETQQFEKNGQSLMYYRFDNLKNGKDKFKIYYWHHNGKYYGIKYLQYNFVYWQKFLNLWMKQYGVTNEIDFSRDPQHPKNTKPVILTPVELQTQEGQEEHKSRQQSSVLQNIQQITDADLIESKQKLSPQESTKKSALPEAGKEELEVLKTKTYQFSQQKITAAAKIRDKQQLKSQLKTLFKEFEKLSYECYTFLKTNSAYEIDKDSKDKLDKFQTLTIQNLKKLWKNNFTDREKPPNTQTGDQQDRTRRIEDIVDQADFSRMDYSQLRHKRGELISAGRDMRGLNLSDEKQKEIQKNIDKRIDAIDKQSRKLNDDARIAAIDEQSRELNNSKKETKTSTKTADINQTNGQVLTEPPDVNDISETITELHHSGEMDDK